MKPLTNQEAEERIALHRKRSEDCMKLLHGMAMATNVSDADRIAAAAAYLQHANSGVRRVPGVLSPPDEGR